MADDATKTITKVTDLSDIGPRQLALLMKKANSIHLYYKCLVELQKKPAQAVKIVRETIAGAFSIRQFWRILFDFESNNFTFKLSLKGWHEGDG